MKSTIFSLAMILAALTSPLFAQDANAPITDEELNKYAVAMDSINELQTELSNTIKTMVTSNANITATRYNELYKVINDEGKLLEAQATPEEIEFVKSVIAKREEETAKIKQAYQLLAKDYVGATTFNKVRKALTTDESLKTKYDTLLSELAKDNEIN